MDDSISTDLRSDISFMNKQKELRMLYRDFKNALDSFHSSAPIKKSNINEFDEEEEEEEEYEENIQSQPLSNDAEMIIQEIELMNAETDEISELISKPNFDQGSRVRAIKKQLIHLKRVNNSLLARAEAIREKNNYEEM